MAILGGLVLCALVLLTCVSVLGRGLNTLGHSAPLEGSLPALSALLLGTGVGPVPGDFELVEAGVAFAIFAFLPICQLHGAHASVDVFTGLLPRAVQRAIVAFWELVLAATIALLAWRLFVGLQGKLANGETTFMLQFPLWWSYAASFAAAAVAVLVALYCAAARLARLGRDDLPIGGSLVAPREGTRLAAVPGVDPAEVPPLGKGGSRSGTPAGIPSAASVGGENGGENRGGSGGGSGGENGGENGDENGGGDAPERGR